MRRFGAPLALAMAAFAIVLTGAAGSASTGDAALLPPGWQRAKQRLVPGLLSPREILSLGTSAMPVGGGGNCGREPIAAIERMEPGDALISIQEYAVSGPMRARIGTRSAPPPLRESVKALRLHRQPHPRGEPIPDGRALWSATLAFSDHGRWFDALVYVRGRPTPLRLDQIHSILNHLRFLSEGR